MKRRFSIIIAGYKDTSRQTLEGVLAQEVSGDLEFEVVMLDNTRDSRHAGMAEQCFANTPSAAARKIYVPQTTPGKSETQNHGIRQAQGTHYIFLDDDVLPERDLVQEYDKAFQSQACGAVQGRVELMYVDGAVPPPWLNDRFRLDLAEMDFGEVIFPFEMGLTGANMAFRADVFEKCGLFDERFGPARTGTLEDQEFSERIQAAGETQLFWPGASVRHMIPPERLTIKAFACIYYDVGFSDYLLSSHLVKGGPARLALYSMRKAAGKALSALACLCAGRRSDAIHRYCEIHGIYAFWKQARIQHRSSAAA